MTFARAGRLGALLLLLGGCGKTTLRGGHVVPRGQEPSGRVLMRYEPIGCVDAARQPALVDLGNVWLVRVEGGEDVLVTTTPGYDSVVVDNEFIAAGERVFQLSVEGGPGPYVLVDYRFPVLGEGPGRLALVRTWREVRRKQPRVRAHFDRAVVTCHLEPAPVDEASLLGGPPAPNTAPPPGRRRKVAPVTGERPEQG